MAWTDVHIIHLEPLVETLYRDGSVRASAGWTFYAEADAPFTLDTAMTATFGGVGVTALGASYSATRPNCTCRKRSAEFVSPTQAKVVCSFEDPTDGSSSSVLQTKAARITNTDEAVIEAYQEDSDGFKVVNKAGGLFDNAPQRQTGVTVYTIKKYVTSTVKAQIKAAWNTNNNSEKVIDSDTWAADELWLFSRSFEPVAGSSLWNATLIIKGKPGGWVDRPLNVGYRDRDDWVIMKEKQPVDSAAPNGPFKYVACSKPWPLDGLGDAKAGPKPSVDALAFYPYKRNSWTGVPIA